MEALLKFFLLMFFQMSLVAQAALNRGPETAFKEEVMNLKTSCSRVGCKGPYQREALKEASEELAQAIQAKANDLAQIWGDTILEGDYVADGKTQVDEVYVLVKNGEVFGYRITYSENAWYTANCDFDGDMQHLDGCEQGRISEASYVNADFTLDFLDPARFAEFKQQVVILE